MAVASVSLLDFTGQRFGRLTAREIVFLPGKGKTKFWRCDCDCGAEISVRPNQLHAGRVVSCGCQKRERTIERNTTHGLGRPPEYTVWSNMKNRCLNPNSEAFSDYGARGITVCSEWLSFERFYADMGPRPTDKHTLERIDNNLGYGPDNCKWATRKEQTLNYRRNHLLTFDGRTQTVKEWADEKGLKPHTLLQRLRRGMATAEALTKPLRRW